MTPKASRLGKGVFEARQAAQPRCQDGWQWVATPHGESQHPGRMFRGRPSFGWYAKLKRLDQRTKIKLSTAAPTRTVFPER